nr:putative metallopeptidase [Devosia insulae]
MSAILGCKGVLDVLPGRPYLPQPVPAKDVLELRDAEARHLLDDTDEARRLRDETVKNTLADMRRRLATKPVRIKDLYFATLGALWTNVANGRSGKRIVGQCERGLPPAGKWMRGRIEMQLIGWFGAAPDFLLTFDAAYCSTCSDAEFMALVEHELYHAGQEHDEFGSPKFTKHGAPKFAMRGHDVEEFVGVVRRYGAGAAHIQPLIDAANARPEIAKVDIARACGTCQLRAA